MNQSKKSNKKIVKSLMTLVTLSFMVFLVACGGRNDELVGRWVFEADPSWVTTFNEDGSGTHAISWGYGTTFQWTTPNNNIRWNYPGHSNMDTPFRIDGNGLYITMADGTVFRYIRD